MKKKPGENLTNFPTTDKNIALARWYYNLGLKKAEKGRYKTAIEDYNKAVTLNPNDEICHYLRAIAYLKLGNYEKAILNLKAAARLGHSEAEKLLIELGGNFPIESLLQGIKQLPQTETIYTRACSACNKIFQTHNPRQKYCSGKCRQSSKQSLRPEKIYFKVCPVCKKEFQTKSSSKVFCSNSCRQWRQYFRLNKSDQVNKT